MSPSLCPFNPQRTIHFLLPKQPKQSLWLPWKSCARRSKWYKNLTILHSRHNSAFIYRIMLPRGRAKVMTRVTTRIQAKRKRARARYVWMTWWFLLLITDIRLLQVCWACGKSVCTAYCYQNAEGEHISLTCSMLDVWAMSMVCDFILPLFDNNLFGSQ